MAVPTGTGRPAGPCRPAEQRLLLTGKARGAPPERRPPPFESRLGPRQWPPRLQPFAEGDRAPGKTGGRRPKENGRLEPEVSEGLVEKVTADTDLRRGRVARGHLVTTAQAEGREPAQALW